MTVERLFEVFRHCINSVQCGIDPFRSEMRSRNKAALADDEIEQVMSMTLEQVRQSLEPLLKLE